MAKWKFDDGGLGEHGIRASRRNNDCAIRALAIATGQRYADVWSAFGLDPVISSERLAHDLGITDVATIRVYRQFGMVAHQLPVHVTLDNAPAIWPNGIFLLRYLRNGRLSGDSHTVAVKRGRLHDTGSV